MKRHKKSEIVDFLINNAVQRVVVLDEDDDEVDEILDELMENVVKTLYFRSTPRYTVPKSSDWVMNILPAYDDLRFLSLLRVSRIEFRLILSEIEGDPVFGGHTSSLQHPVYFQLAVVLYRLGEHGESATVRKISTKFGVGDGGTLQKITARVFCAVKKLQTKFLNWPSIAERNTICEVTNNEMPGCIGYLDVSEIKLFDKPIRNHEDYFSRKHQYSVKLLAICDHSTKIRYLTTGYPGSIDDARIFNECAFSCNTDSFLSDSQWIAADSAFKLTPTTITPYRKNSSEVSLSQSLQFNKCLSSYRIRINHCFGRLKEKFASLKELRIRLGSNASHRFLCEWILVCCILYNIVLPEAVENFESDSVSESEPECDEDFGISDTMGELRRQLIYGKCATNR